MEPSSEKKTALAKWLDTIQQDSWQLELIISGVVIFLMLAAYEPLEELRRSVALDIFTGNKILVVTTGGYFIFRAAYFSLLIIFLIHLTLRGLWIGAVGLRSVSGDFDYDVLEYPPRFNRWLERQLGSFDDYIERLEIQCSIAFSFAFLLFFSVISAGIYLFFIGGVTALVAWLTGGTQTEDPSSWQVGLTAAVNLLLVFIGLIYLIDFSTLGWVKKRRRLLRFYYPIYRFMGWITLAFFYRPFYYNLIDHSLGRNLVKRLWLIILAGLIVISITIVRFEYFPTDSTGASILSQGYYEDRYGPDTSIPFTSPSIASRYAQEDYLQIFLPYLVVSNDRALQYLYPKLTKAHTSTFAIDGPLHLWDSENGEVNNDSLLLAHRSLHRLYLNDSLLPNVNWRFYRHPERNQPGLVYDLPVYDLPRGEHLLRFDDQMLNS
ncbi:MAG: hypothetical protein AAGF89_16440, partial [Bacteroidota bacterium]